MKFDTSNLYCNQFWLFICKTLWLTWHTLCQNCLCEKSTNFHRTNSVIIVYQEILTKSKSEDHIYVMCKLSLQSTKCAFSEVVDKCNVYSLYKGILYIFPKPQQVIQAHRGLITTFAGPQHVIQNTKYLPQPLQVLNR